MLKERFVNFQFSHFKSNYNFIPKNEAHIQFEEILLCRLFSRNVIFMRNTKFFGNFGAKPMVLRN